MITVADVAVELGRATIPAEGSIEYRQWSRWIEWAYAAVRARADQMGVDYTSLDPVVVDEVVTYIVARRARVPADGAESTSDTVSVDDAQVQRTRKYATYGDLYVLDAWWAKLGLAAQDAGGWSGSVKYAW